MKMVIWVWNVMLVGWLNGGVTTLGQAPDWSQLDPFQGVWKQSDFRSDLEGIYCPRKSWWAPWIKFEDNRVLIRKQTGAEDWYILKFNEQSPLSDDGVAKAVPNKIRRIAIDPGHIGGKYSEMEGRHFRMGDDPFVKEGDLTLQVARRLKSLLDARGFESFLIRENVEPVTPKRPQDFAQLAEKWIKEIDRKVLSPQELEELKTKRQEMLFYRVSEIRARAQKVNESLKPDLVICLHLNAAPWPDPEKKGLVDRNDYHVLVNGCYMGGELAYDDQRFEMLYRLLSGWTVIEQAVAEEISREFGELPNFPAFAYKGPNAVKVGKLPGVWARNLLANRIFKCPVVFLEPYIANSEFEYNRIQLGDYPGTRGIEGHQRMAIIEEYAQTVFKAIIRYTGTKK